MSKDIDETETWAEIEMYSQAGLLRTNRSFLLSRYASNYAKHWVREEIWEVTSHQLNLFLRSIFRSGIPAWHTEEVGVLKELERQRKHIFAVRNTIDPWLSGYNRLRTMCNVLCISYYVDHREHVEHREWQWSAPPLKKKWIQGLNQNICCNKFFIHFHI